MIIHQVFAQIFEGQVKNIVVCENYEMANYLAKATYGDTAFAVDCLQHPCILGDFYRNGSFYRVGEDGAEKKLNYLPTQEQEVKELKAQNEELVIAVADVIGGTYSA